MYARSIVYRSILVMRKENLKLAAVIIAGLFIYLLFFIETVEDVAVDKHPYETEEVKTKKDSLFIKDTIR